MRNGRTVQVVRLPMGSIGASLIHLDFSKKASARLQPYMYITSKLHYVDSSIGKIRMLIVD